MPCFGLRLKTAENATSDGRSTSLLHAAHHHARVGCFHDDGNALRVQNVHDSICDLFRKTFLNLQPPGIHLSDARELGEPNHGSRGDVANMHLIKVVS